MQRPALSSQLKNGINAALRHVGLQVTTLRKQAAESERLRQVANRGHWSAPRYAHGLRLESPDYLKFLQDVGRPYRSEFAAMALHSERHGFPPRNGWFESLDAEVLYCMVRHFQPLRIVEIGSGFSTRLMRNAITDGGFQTKLVSIDPEPRTDVAGFADEHIAEPVEALDLRLLQQLGANDILFIDSSHVISTGGDVPHLCLEVLPNLRPGVLVHFHDIFLPFEYPQSFVRGCKWGWTEQYLVCALLANNQAYKIVWPAFYMWKECPDALKQLASYDPQAFPPSSLWLKKVSKDGDYE